MVSNPTLSAITQANKRLSGRFFVVPVVRATSCGWLFRVCSWPNACALLGLRFFPDFGHLRAPFIQFLIFVLELYRDGFERAHFFSSSLRFSFDRILDSRRSVSSPLKSLAFSRYSSEGVFFIVSHPRFLEVPQVLMLHPYPAGDLPRSDDSDGGTTKSGRD